jgi:hypothetical protein
MTVICPNVLLYRWKGNLQRVAAIRKGSTIKLWRANTIQKANQIWERAKSTDLVALCGRTKFGIQYVCNLHPVDKQTSVLPVSFNIGRLWEPELGLRPISELSVVPAWVLGVLTAELDLLLLGQPDALRHRHTTHRVDASIRWDLRWANTVHGGWGGYR